ncbi:Uncharacterised protein [Moellerella wisconsensis]|nr:Uncharacterised protein [Moellerella wisconsensis]
MILKKSNYVYIPLSILMLSLSTVASKIKAILMFKHHVNSPNIYTIGYDNETKVLEINFISNRTIKYINVPLINYQRLTVAKDKEHYIEKYINNKYLKIKDC